MNQTPAHEMVNTDLVALIPDDATHIVDVGCMHGVLARTCRQKNPELQVTGIDIDPDYAHAAKAHCTATVAGNIETFDASQFESLFPSDCWVFGDCLEHLHDPWSLLRRLRDRIDPGGSVIVCIPNAQHWSVQWRLLTGNFRYEDSGLMDRTHIRWFTRATLVEMFVETGWHIDQALSRNIGNQQQDEMLQAVRTFAQACNVDAETAVQDARPIQYLFRLTPGTLQ